MSAIIFGTALVGGMLIFSGGPPGALATLCLPKFLSCPCGKTQDRIVIADKMCDGITDFEICSYFRNCTMCTTKPIDCPECSVGRYKGSYHKECSGKILRNNHWIDMCMCYSTYTTNLASVTVSWASNTIFAGEKVNGNRTTRQTLSECPDPEIPDNGGLESAQGVTTSAGSVVRFYCNAGYMLSGSSVAVCMDGPPTWSSDAPKCILLESSVSPSTIKLSTVKDDAPLCQKPPEPKHGTITIKIRGSDSVRSANFFEVSTSVEYQCDHPYKLDGQPSQVCLATGHWSGSTPTCSPTCGKGVEPKSPYLVNGRVAKQNGYPWQVALTTYETRAAQLIHCGGVVISEKWVLTAAHCITESGSRKLLSSDTFLLFFGKHYAARGSDNNDVASRKVFQLVLHPKYDPWTFDSDLGLMLLEQEVIFNAAVLPLCLPDVNSTVTYQVKVKGVVTGWGITEEGTTAEVLMVLELPTVDSKICEESYIRRDFNTTFTDNMFCAGIDKGGENTCHGDSGGPMAFYKDDHYVLEGIVSWGNPKECAAAGYYGVFVRVRNFVPWIQMYV